MTDLTPAQTALHQLKDHINTQIIGQDVLVERMLIALLADGHLLVEAHNNQQNWKYVPG